jgi:hypothetical protein
VRKNANLGIRVPRSLIRVPSSDPLKEHVYKFKSYTSRLHPHDLSQSAALREGPLEAIGGS